MARPQPGETFDLDVDNSKLIGSGEISNNNSGPKGKKALSWKDIVAPPIVVVSLLVTNYSFVLIEVVPKYASLTWYNYLIIVSYELIFLMTVWSYIRLVFSDPGFIPKNYAYKISELSGSDQLLIRFVLEDGKEE